MTSLRPGSDHDERKEFRIDQGDACQGSGVVIRRDYPTNVPESLAGEFVDEYENAELSVPATRAAFHAQSRPPSLTTPGWSGPSAAQQIVRELAVSQAMHNVVRESAQHTAEEWEARKEEVRCLYLKQQKTLREVVKIMNDKGFRATERMYKTRISEWGFMKNSKRIGRSSNGLSAKGNRTRTLTGRGDSIRDARTLAGHPGYQIDLNEWRAAGMALREDHLLLAMVTSPDALLFREQVVGGLRDLLNYHYSLDSRFNRGIVPFLGHVLSKSRHTVNDLIQASWFFGQHHIDEGVRFAKDALDFDNLLEFHLSDSFYSLLYLFISVTRWKDSGLMEILWKCLARSTKDTELKGKYQKYRLGPYHTLSILIGRMQAFYQTHGSSEFAAVVSDAMRSVFDVIDDMNNVDDFCMTWLKCDYAWSSGLDKWWVEKLAGQVLKLRDSLEGPLDTSEVQAWANSMSVHLQAVKGLDGDESEMKLSREEDIIQSLGGTGMDYDSDTVQALCFRTMAQYHMGLCTMQQQHSVEGTRHGSRKHPLDKSTVFDVAHWDLGQRITLATLKSLEAWNAEASRWAEVEAAKVKWMTGMWMMQQGDML